MKVQIAGPGCPKCQTTEKTVRDALAELNKKADVSHVTDFKEIAQLGVRMTPAVIIDGKVVMSGRVPSTAEAKDLLQSGSSS